MSYFSAVMVCFVTCRSQSLSDGHAAVWVQGDEVTDDSTLTRSDSHRDRTSLAAAGSTASSSSSQDLQQTSSTMTTTAARPTPADSTLRR